MEKLAQSCDGGLCIFSGEPEGVRSEPDGRLEHACHVPARNIRFLPGRFRLNWQPGVDEWLASWQPDVLIAQANPRYLSARRAAAVPAATSTRVSNQPPTVKKTMRDRMPSRLVPVNWLTRPNTRGPMTPASLPLLE